MKVLVYSARPYDQEFLKAANHGKHELHFVEARLEERTAVLARQYPAVCCFVDDILSKKVIKRLSDGGTRLVALLQEAYGGLAGLAFGLLVEGLEDLFELRDVAFGFF